MKRKLILCHMAGAFLIVVTAQANALCNKLLDKVCVEAERKVGWNEDCTARCEVAIITDDKTKKEKRIEIIYDDEIPSRIDLRKAK